MVMLFYGTIPLRNATAKKDLSPDFVNSLDSSKRYVVNLLIYEKYIKSLETLIQTIELMCVTKKQLSHNMTY